MPDLLVLQPYKIVITRFFFPVLYYKLLRNIYGTYDKIFGMCASINNKNCSCKPGIFFITQNHLLILWGKKHREKVHNTGKTQGILSRLECGHPGWCSASLKTSTKYRGKACSHVTFCISVKRSSLTFSVFASPS